jgi:hypothetical protein
MFETIGALDIYVELEAKMARWEALSINLGNMPLPSGIKQLFL